MQVLFPIQERISHCIRPFPPDFHGPCGLTALSNPLVGPHQVLNFWADRTSEQWQLSNDSTLPRTLGFLYTRCLAIKWRPMSYPGSLQWYREKQPLFPWNYKSSYNETFHYCSWSITFPNMINWSRGLSLPAKEKRTTYLFKETWGCALLFWKMADTREPSQLYRTWVELGKAFS